jgi:hypothetical protein
MASFTPTFTAVYSVRASLAALGLPNELILNILDQAGYWVERQHDCTRYEVLMGDRFSSNFSGTTLCLSMAAFSGAPPSVTEAPKIKAIEFTIVGHGKPTRANDVYAEKVTLFIDKRRSRLDDRRFTRHIQDLFLI